MNLGPMTATPDPIYPTYNRAPTAWRRIAAAVALSATLWPIFDSEILESP